MKNLKSFTHVLFEIFIIYFLTAAPNFAQLTTERADPPAITDVEVDAFGIIGSNLNDFHLFSCVYEAWGEWFSDDLEFGYIIQKNINGVWTTVYNDAFDNLGHASFGMRWVNYYSNKNMAQEAGSYGNGNFRAKGWVYAWNAPTYDEWNNWSYTTIHDVTNPATPGCTGSWNAQDHPVLTIDGVSVRDLEKFEINKKVNSGNYTYFSEISPVYNDLNTNSEAVFIDYSETRYTVGGDGKRFVYYTVASVDFCGNKSETTTPNSFVCDDWLNKENPEETSDVEFVNSWELKQNYPNPFNPETNITYQIAKRSFVNLDVFNMLGQKVRTLVQGYKDAGRCSVRFDASGLPNGIYVFRIKANNFSQTRKMIFLK